MGHSKVMLEKELQEVIALTSQELEEYREKVLELEDEVGELVVTRQSVRATPLHCSSGAEIKDPGASAWVACVLNLTALPSTPVRPPLWIFDCPSVDSPHPMHGNNNC